jgi:hypothetical protein
MNSIATFCRSAALAACLAGCGASDQSAGPPHQQQAQAEPPTPAHLPLDAPEGVAKAVGKPVHLEARDLLLLAEGAEVRVAYLSGELTPAKGGDLVDLESPRSFEVRIDALEIAIPEQTIESGITSRKPPFKELKVTTDGDSLQLDGRGGPLGLPFSFRAEPRVSPGGSLVLSLEKVRLVGVGVKGFLGAFPNAIENAANKRGHLVEVVEDQLVINPFPFMGPPEVHAEFTSVEVRKNEIVARLGALSSTADAVGEAGIVLSGGTLRTGGMILFDTSIHLVPEPKGAEAVPAGDVPVEKGSVLAINPDTFDRQVEHGFIKQAHDGSVTVYVSAPE